MSVLGPLHNVPGVNKVQGPSEGSDNSQDRRGGRRQQQQPPLSGQASHQPPSGGQADPSLKDRSLPALDIKLAIAATLTPFPPHNWRRDTTDKAAATKSNEALGWDPAWGPPPVTPEQELHQTEEAVQQSIELSLTPELNLSKIPRGSHMMVAGELFNRHPLYLIRNLSKFPEQDLPEIAELFLRRTPQGITTCGDLLAANLHRFTGLNHQAIFNRLLEASSDDAKAAISNFDQFKGIEPNSAALRVLVISGCADCLADHIDKFPGVDRADLASKLQEPRIGAFIALARNAQKFPTVNHAELLTRFLRSRPHTSELAHFVQHVGNLTQIDHAAFAKFLTTACPDALAENISSFPGVDRNALATKLMSPKIAAFPALARNIALFPDLDQKKLVQSFFKTSPAADQLSAFFAELSHLDRIDPCWLIKAIINYDFESLTWLQGSFISPSVKFDREKLLDVFITQTEKHIERSRNNLPSSPPYIREEYDHNLRLLASNTIELLIRLTPAEHRLDFAHSLASYDDTYVSSLAHCLHFFEDSALETIVELLIAAGHVSRDALLSRSSIFDLDDRVTIMLRIIETDPTDGSRLILSNVRNLDKFGQTLVLDKLIEVGQFEVIDMLTWEIPLHDINILRSLLKNLPNSPLAKSIGLHDISSATDKALARASRRVLAERRGQSHLDPDDLDFDREDNLKLIYRRNPSILVSLKRNSALRSILGTSERNQPRLLPAKSQAEWRKTLNKDIYIAAELAANLTRIIPQKSDIPLLSSLAASGHSEAVLGILDRYPDIAPKELKQIHFAIAKGYIVAGYFEMADRYISQERIPDAAFAKYLEVSAWKHFRSNDFYPLFALSAWARCRPSADLSLQGLLTSEIYKQFVSPFVPHPQSKKSYNSPSEIFIRVGLPFLRERGFLSDASIDFVSNVASLFLQNNASTATAWECHKANFGPWLIGRRNVKEELASILSFYRDYPRLQAPGLRSVIRQLSSLGLPLRDLSADDVRKRIEAFRKDLSVVGSETFPGEERVHEAFGGPASTILEDEKRRRDRSILTGNLDAPSVNTYCGNLLHEILTAQQYPPLGYFDLELLSGLTGVKDIDVMMGRYAHLYIDFLKGKVAPINSNIIGRSFDFTAERLSREAAQLFTFSDPSKALYQTTRDALLHFKQSGDLSALTTRKGAITSALQDTADDISRKASSLPKAQAEKLLYRNNLIKAAIESIAQAQSMSELLYALCKHSDSDKQLKGHIREVALALACGSTELKGHEIDALGSQEPSRESIAQMYEILQEKVLHNSTLVEAVGDDMPALRAALGVATFEEELRKLGKIGTRGVESIRAYATRGLLGELAGFIGESCLTRQEDLMRRHPNATAIIFVKNADKPESIRLEGSCMLLTVKDNDGNDVLVIRGLNPTQNLILSLSAASFFEQFLEHVVKPIAKKLHIKKIAIPTPQKDIFFEARTNRPSLAVYLTDRCANLPSITFENDRDRAVFNDNSFEKSCVLLWSDPE